MTYFFDRDTAKSSLADVGRSKAINDEIPFEVWFNTLTEKNTRRLKTFG